MLRAQLDEVRLPVGTVYSRRPIVRARMCAGDIEVIATPKGGAVVCALCRRLIEIGHDPAEPLEVYRGQILALKVRSIGAAAGLMVDESTGPPRFGRWKPHPRQDGGISSGISPPVRSDEEGATLVASQAADAPEAA
jgi:hypothetical protein